MTTSRGWEMYAPPIIPIGRYLAPKVTFDFRQGRVILSPDALAYLQSFRVCLKADRSQYRLEIHPIHVTEAPGGVSIARGGCLQGSREVMQWLRIDTVARDARILEMAMKPNGVLLLDYKDVCSVRAAAMARKLEEDGEEVGKPVKARQVSSRMAKVTEDGALAGI